ncbi:Uncharacterised protein (plasmid) [Escherichia coli]|nr:Uncharacterised protein [Escherichia coli]
MIKVKVGVSLDMELLYYKESMKNPGAVTE